MMKRKGALVEMTQVVSRESGKHGYLHTRKRLLKADKIKLISFSRGKVKIPMDIKVI